MVQRPRREVLIDRGLDPDHAFTLSKAQIEEALTKTFSCISAAAKVYKYPDGSEIPRETFRSWMRKYGINPYDEYFRNNMVEGALDVLVKLAHKGKERSLHKLLDTWGKHVGFNPPPKEVNLHSTSGNPFQEALCTVDPTYEAVLIQNGVLDHKQEEKDDGF